MTNSMKKPRTLRRSHLLLVAGGAAWCPAMFAMGGIDNWNTGDGNWSVAGNWDSGTVPAANDTVNVAFADGVNRTVNYDYTGAAVSLFTLTLDQTNTSGTAASVLAMQGNALSAYAEYVGNSGSGMIAQSGGTNTIGAGILYLGKNAGASGTYTLSGSGTLSAPFENVGFNGSGSITQTGGANTNGRLSLGLSSGSIGAYNLGGNGTLTAGVEDVGVVGSGTFVQNGGSNSVGGNDFYPFVVGGAQPTSSGQYSLGAGSLSVTGSEYVGYYCNASFIQTGGTNTVNPTNVPFIGESLYINYTYSPSGGRVPPPTCTYSLSNTGALVVAGTEYLGGPAYFQQSGGTNTAGGLSIGTSSDPLVSSYTQTGGTLKVTGTLTLNSTSSSFDLQAGTASAGTYLQTAGTSTIVGTLTVPGGITVNGGTFQIGANGTAGLVNAALQNNASVLVQGGASGAPSTVAKITGTGALTVGTSQAPAYLRISSYKAASQQASLAIFPGSTLDIGNGSFAINYGNTTDPLTTIRGYLQSGYNGGLWTGTGLTSSRVQADIANAIINGGGVYGIGCVDGALDNQAANAVVKATGNQIVIAPALVGDANLDGSVSFIDLGIVAQNLGSINGDWSHGDFNYDGAVNFLDIGLLAQNLSYTTLNTPLDQLIPDPSAALEAQWNLAVAELQSNSTQPTDLPEPAVGGILTTAAAGLLARRRRDGGNRRG